MEEVLVQPGVNVVQLQSNFFSLNSAVPSLSKCIATPSSTNLVAISGSFQTFLNCLN